MAWYAKFDGVDGGAQQKDHKNWINLASFNMGGHKAGGGGTGVGRVGGKMHLEDISMGVISDKSLPKLLEGAVKGKVYPKVEIHGTATYNDSGEQIYLAIELKNTQITSYQLGVLDNDAATDDMSMSLNFEEYKLTSTEYKKDGSKGGNVETTWKVEEGET
ncbi:MAG: type VI secretion system tube protein Hcp [Planctomycetota bacterium]